MPIRLMFDVESIDLMKSGFAYGYVVIEDDEATGEIKLLEEGDCYSIEGAQIVHQDNTPDNFVKKNILPLLHELKPYLEVDIASINKQELPNNIVVTLLELRHRFYDVYTRWRGKAQIWSDVNFPVETFFLTEIALDDYAQRHDQMPYPLLDAVHFVDKDIDRIIYSGLHDLIKHRPKDDARASAYSLIRGLKEYTYASAYNKEKIINRFVFDVGAQNLHKDAFAYGGIITSYNTETNEISILKLTQCYSILSAKNADDYVRTHSLPNLTFLHPYLEKSEDQLRHTLLPRHMVLSFHELVEKFYKSYTLYKALGLEVWAADVKYPVEACFLMAMVRNGNGSRDFNMPYPFYDISTWLDANISRIEYTGLQHVKKGHPLHHAICSSCALHLFEIANLPYEPKKKAHISAQIRGAFQLEIDKDNALMAKLSDAVLTNTLLRSGSPLHTLQAPSQEASSSRKRLRNSLG